MGQKVHPLGLRLGITQKHRSVWCSDFKNQYSNTVIEDHIIRSFILKKYPKSKIINILIKRKFEENYNSISIIIHTHLSVKQFLAWNMNQPNTKKLKLNKKKSKSNKTIVNSKQLIELKKNLINQLKQNIQLKNCTSIIEQLNIKRIWDPYSSSKAEILADSLIKSLEQRMLFKKALKKILRKKVKINKIFEKYFKMKDGYIKGIKIQISGRLNGAEIARTEWVREGRVPLHTFCANIDYSYKTAKTIYGILGVKIWLFKGEKRKIKKNLSLT